MPSMKSVTEKPEYSKCRNRPTRIPRAIDIIPSAIILSFLSGTLFTSLDVPYEKIYAINAASDTAISDSQLVKEE